MINKTILLMFLFLLSGCSHIVYIPSEYKINGEVTMLACGANYRSAPMPAQILKVTEDKITFRVYAPYLQKFLILEAKCFEYKYY